MSTALACDSTVLDSPAACRGRQQHEPAAADERWRTAYHLLMKAGELLVSAGRFGEASTAFLNAAMLPARTGLAFFLGRPNAQLCSFEIALAKLRSCGLIDRDLFDAISAAMKASPWDRPSGAQNMADIAGTLFECFGDAGRPGGKPARDIHDARRVYRGCQPPLRARLGSRSLSAMAATK